MLPQKLQTLLSRYDLKRYTLHPRLWDAPYNELFRARILAGLCAVSLIFVPIVFLYMAPNYGSSILAHTFAFALFLLGAIVSLSILKLFGSFRWAACALLLCPLAGLILFVCLEQVAISGTFFWFAGLGLFGLYIFGLRYGKYWCLLVLSCQMGLIHIFRDTVGMIPPSMSHSEFINIFSGDVLGVTLGIWTVAALYEWQRKKSEDELNQTQLELLQHREKLMQDARLTELGQMAGGVAHEINNPLAIIHGYTVRLRRDLEQHRELTTEQGAMLHSIERSCQRIATISRALLSYAHEGSYEQDVEFSLQKLQEEALELCQERLHNRLIDFRVECSDPLPSMWGKYVKLLQVIVNLLNNAIDAVAECHEKWIELKIDWKDQALYISVMDSGEGVPSQLRDRINSPFFTTKPIGKGTGLGLSIVDGILRDIKGNFYLDVQSKHTRFVVFFPLASPPI